MNLVDLGLKLKYRSSNDDIVKSFFIPTLSCAKVYKRAAGFFSSSSLIEVSKGITGLVKNKGKTYIIASPYLQEKDIKAINKGYEIREKVIEEALLNSFDHPKNFFEEERLNLLAHLIATNQLDIKIAFMENKGKLGVYHEKIGIIEDFDGNKIAFTGSLNESSNAFTKNFESIDVFFSWGGKDNQIRVIDKERDFNRLWDDDTRKVRVIGFPKVVKKRLLSYKRDSLNLDVDRLQFADKSTEIKEQGSDYKLTKNLEDYYPKVPPDITLYDYQKEAVGAWEQKGYKGIFDMATGTGKTITGLAAIARLSKKVDHKLAVIIVCPYQHLVEQWVEDIIKFNMKPIIGYSASKQKNWKKRLKNAIIAFNLQVKKHICFVTTNATFSSNFVQEHIDRIKGNVVIVIDEAHHFGALNLSRTLNPKIPYRLALSATLERHMDEEGTKKLFDYFGEKCIEYTIERAIKEKKLAPYYYYPIQVHLNDQELEEYKAISRELVKHYSNKKSGRLKIDEIGKILLIKRARIVAAATDKISKLGNIMQQYKNASHILVYCGATTMRDPGYREGKGDSDEIRQIEAVSDLLGNKLNMRIAQFTSSESAEEREILKRGFAEGKHVQALVAIRCLDEGVNIPSIKMAFILASSTNPKEYVQRRGRVLRKAPGKEYAIIYDFITMPRPLDEVKYLPREETRGDLSLVKKEMERMKDFASIAENPSCVDSLITKIQDAYDLLLIRGDNYEFWD